MTHNAGGGGIGTEGDPFTLAQAADTVAADDLVWVKATGIYEIEDGANDCVLHITTAGAQQTYIVWKGYTSVIGDSGIVTINANPAGDQFASCVLTAIGAAVYNAFYNFRFTGASGDCFDANGITDDNIVFYNCRFDLAGGWGFQGDNIHIFVKCTFDNNTAGGADPDDAWFIGCIGHTGGEITQGGVVLLSLFYNNAAVSNIYLNWGGISLAIGNSIDGDGNASSKGYFNDSPNSACMIVLNNIFYDLGVGLMKDGVGTIGSHPSNYNLFFSNDTPRTNFQVGDNDVAGSEDPFTNSGARDYTLKAASEALNVGFDAGDV